MIKIKSLITSVLIAVCLAMPLKAIEPVINNDNDDKFLLLFIAGLGGAKTWDSLISLIKNDSALKKFDVYVYDPLNSGGNITESSAELKRFIQSAQIATYQEVFIVAHSIGGIITKDYLLNNLQNYSSSELKEKHVLFIGTPHIKNTFTAPKIKKFFGYMFYFTLSDLAKDALNATGIKDINHKWINTVEANQGKYIKNLALFGNDDDVVAPEDLHDIFIGEYLVIKGTHLGIAQSDNEFNCTYLIMKRKLLDPDSSISDLGCSVK